MCSRFYELIIAELFFYVNIFFIYYIIIFFPKNIKYVIMFLLMELNKRLTKGEIHYAKNFFYGSRWYTFK